MHVPMSKWMCMCVSANGARLFSTCMTWHTWVQSFSFVWLIAKYTICVCLCLCVSVFVCFFFDSLWFNWLYTHIFEVQNTLWLKCMWIVLNVWLLFVVPNEMHTIASLYSFYYSPLYTPAWKICGSKLLYFFASPLLFGIRLVVIETMLYV